MQDIRQSQNYANYLKSIGWKVYKSNGTNYFLKKIIFFNTVKVQRPHKLSEKLIKEIISRHRPLHLIVEPTDFRQEKLLKKLNFRLSKSPYLPSKSLILDISEDKIRLFDQLKKDARYSISKSALIKYFKDTNINQFYKAWKGSVGVRRIILSLKELRSLKKSFPTSSLLLASHND